MDCPYGDSSGDRRAIHAHLGEAHRDRVAVRTVEDGRRFYEIRCPVCDAPWEREIKPRYHDPGFIEEFEREIVLVAFDMLLYHVQGEHMEGESA